MNRNVWLLFCCQALGGLAGISQVAMSALIGYSLATDKTLATVPYALQMLGMMAAAIPAGLVFARLGRQAGFMGGLGLALLGGVLQAAGVWRGDFLLFCVGSLPTGMSFGIGQQYRFAAAEVADTAARPRAIGLVLAGGVLAAILGPELVKSSKDLFAPVLFLGTLVVLLVLPLASALLLSLTALPPAAPPQRVRTPLREIIARPTFLVAVTAGLVGYGTMNLIMAATPLEMMMCGFDVDASIDVIRVHSIAMFAPGFFTGRLIQRWGVHRVIVVGGVLNIGCAVLALAGSSFTVFMVALTLLGLGWNFMFVGATTLLTSAHDAAERVRAQAANDFIVFSTVAFTAFASGALHNATGWVAVNLAVIPGVVLAAILVLWHRGWSASRDAEARAQ